MKVFPTAWGQPDFETVPTPKEPCVVCEQSFLPTDLGVLIPHHDDNGVVDRPWHRDCFLASLGIELEPDDVLCHEWHLVDTVKEKPDG